MKVKTNSLELRGIANKQSSKGVYYMVNLEEDDGTPVAFYARDASGFPAGLKKGDKVYALCEVVRFDRQERLVCVGLEKVGG